MGVFEEFRDFSWIAASVLDSWIPGYFETNAEFGGRSAVFLFRISGSDIFPVAK